MIFAYGIFIVSIFCFTVWMTELIPSIKSRPVRNTQLNLAGWGLLSLASAQYIWG